MRSVPGAAYDLVISEKLDWHGMDEAFPPDVRKVFLATSMNHVHHNRNVRRRHDRLFERRGATLQLRRIYGESMPAVSDGRRSGRLRRRAQRGHLGRRLPGPIYGFNNYGFPGTGYRPEQKDFAEARRHFLFLASRSQMQKGLDLLLEIFPRYPDLHLYVCSQFEQEPDFCACYRKELFETPNVHALGFVDVFGAAFEELTTTCGYVVTPTCSEGQAGAVVQAMHAGLIPLVTAEAGLSPDGPAIEFADDSIEEIERVIVEVSQLPPEWHRDRSRRTREIALAEYSEDSFVERWREILRAVLADRSAG